jgi:hypothetical protein
MRKLVASLAAFERNGIGNGSNASNASGFSWFATPILPSQQDDKDKAKKLNHVFDLYMPDYENARGNNITNPDLVDKDDLIKAFAAMQSDLDAARVGALDHTSGGDRVLKGNGEASDEFEKRLEARVKAIVASTWNAVTEPKYDKVVVRARSSVFAAHDTAKMHTSASLQNEQRIYIKELTKSDLDVSKHIVDIACAALEPNAGTSDVTKHALEREAEATLRRNILQDFANAAIAKNKQSFPTFLAMMRQLAKMQYAWRDDTYAAKVGETAIKTACAATTGNTGKQARLEALAGNGYFVVPKAEITEWELLKADQFTKDALTNDSGEDHVYARLPSTLVEQSDKGAMLKVEVLQARKDPNDARALADLGTKHTEAETLLGVTLAAVRNGRTVPSRGNLSYAVVFRLVNVWHMFVHVNADPTLLTTFQSRAAADAMKPKIQSSVKALVQKAYDHAKKSNPFKRVVFRNDEWSGLISGVRVPKLDGETKALTELRGEYENDDLVLHVWRDMEFVPAPFAFATPMFR